MPSDPNTPKPVPGGAPTLYAIIGIKLLKGVFFASLALAVYTLSDNNLHGEFEDVTRFLAHWTHLNPEKRFWVELAGKVDKLTEAEMVRAAAGTFVYSLFALVEAFGLMYRIKWIGWLSIGESAFFIPIEVFELIHNFTWLVWGILVLNIFMVWYLFQNRERLFDRRDREVSDTPQVMA